MSNMNPKDRDRRVRAMLLRDGALCHYCKIILVEENTTVDHVIPKARGGCNAIVNLVLACEPCNQARADMSYGKFAERMREAMLLPGPLVRPLGGPARIKQKKKIHLAKLKHRPFEKLVDLPTPEKVS